MADILLSSLMAEPFRDVHADIIQQLINKARTPLEEIQ